MAMSYNYLNNLKYRIEHLEKLVNKKYSVKNEAKQVGTLYHVCSLESYIKYIYPKNILQASGKYNNWLYGSNQYVSFTRDKKFIVNTDYNNSYVMIQLVIDGDKLSENYKIGPYNDFAYDYDGSVDGSDDDPKYREMEEVIKGPIKNISKYIKEIRFDITRLASSDYLDVIKLLKDSSKYLQDAVYFKFLNTKLTFLTEEPLNIKNGSSVYDVISELKEIALFKMLFSNVEWQIKEAIELGADLNKLYPEYGYVTTYYIDEPKRLNIVLNAGADPNIFSKGSDSPLNIAVHNKKYLSAILLIKYGADVNVKDTSGNTPLDIAIKDNDDRMIRILTSACAKSSYVN